MTAASVPKSVPPIPVDLPQLLHSPKTPWHISPALFERIKKQELVDGAGKPFVAVQVLNSDPEYAFVLRYFQHQKPPHYGIKSIRCVHNPDQTKAFEVSFIGMEQAAKSFPPGWSQEEPKGHRAQTIERWKASVAPFSPFQIPSSKRVDTFVGSKIIPLWHGSKQVESICKIGFSFFGKHHFFDKNAKPGAQASTDIGFFGSGIYFTNSSHYASMYHSGTLFLAWVSMREPYPVVNDVPIPKKGADMLKLQGKGAYQNYNAHYIPVTSTDPSSADNMIYHPCHATEQPAWDEYVVFEKAQTLPRFVVELGVDLPVAPSTPSVATVGALTNQLMTLLDNPEIQSDSAMFAILNNKSETLFSLNAQSPLSPEDLAFYNRTMQLLDLKGKIRPIIKQQLTKSPATQKPNAKKDPPLIAKVTKIATAATAATAVSSSGEILNQKTGDTVPALVSIHSESSEKTDVFGYTPLLNAASTGDATLCKTLLAAGANPNAIGKDGFNALHIASWHGKHEVIPAFAAHKQLINAKDTAGKPPLLLAASWGHLKACEELLKAGADPSIVQDGTERNVLHWVSAEGKHEIIPIFVTYKHLFNVRDANGNTPLILAAFGGHPKACEALLKAGADPSVTDKYGRHALDFARLSTSSFKDEVIKLFSSQPAAQNQKTGDAVSLSVGIDPKTLEKTDAEGNTPLLNAAKDGNGALCKALLDAGANPNAVNKKGFNALHIAVQEGKHEAIPLFALHKQLLNAKAINGDTPLVLAAQHGYSKACEALLKAGADPFITNEVGWNALNIAASYGYHDVIPLFAAHKQLLNAKDKYGSTPLMLAARGHLKACEALLKAGADPSITDNEGKNALAYATQSPKGYDDKIIKLLAPFCIDPKSLEERNAIGNTPLLDAAQTGDAGFCKALLSAGANPNATDKYSNNSLHIAAGYGKHDVIPIFAVYKQLLNAKNKQGHTPLMEATLEGHPEACEALLKAGADPSITTGGIVGIGGTNALDMARKYAGSSKDEIIKLLSSYKK